jgi:hypothetical protein
LIATGRAELKELMSACERPLRVLNLGYCGWDPVPERMGGCQLGHHSLVPGDFRKQPPMVIAGTNITMYRSLSTTTTEEEEKREIYT